MTAPPSEAPSTCQPAPSARFAALFALSSLVATLLSPDSAAPLPLASSALPRPLASSATISPMTTVGMHGAGHMGAGLGWALREGGARVVTTLAGRSARTRKMVADAGLEPLDSLDAVVAVAGAGPG